MALLENNCATLQGKIDAMIEHIRPLLRAIFPEEPRPTDPVGVGRVAADQCRRLWPAVQAFVVGAGRYAAATAIAVVRSRYPTVDPDEVALGVPQDFPLDTAIQLRQSSFPAAEALVDDMTLIEDPAAGEQDGGQ